MAENTQGEVQAALKWSKCSRRIYLSAIVFGSLCLTSAVLLSLLVGFRFRSCTDQTSCRWSAVSAKYCGGAAVVLFVLGGSILLVCHQRRQRRSAPQVVFSDIPAREIEAPMLPYNHIPHYQQFVQASSKDLPPDYCSAVQDIDGIYPANAGFWTEDLDASEYENSPPTYEQALKMTELTAAASTEDVNTHFEQGIPEDTRL